MQGRIIEKLKGVFQRSKEQTRICKICFKDIKCGTLLSLIETNSHICQNCLNEFKPKFIKFVSNGIRCISIYDYDEKMRNLIYQFKGCYDYELKDIFMHGYEQYFSLLFKGYTMVPAPSFEPDNIRRGFNHVKEIFLLLKLDMIDAFEKTDKFKQAEHSFKERKNIKNFIKIKDGISFNTDKILLVDDIYTTGSTFKVMAKALKDRGIKKIKGLVICKTRPKDYEN